MSNLTERTYPDPITGEPITVPLTPEQIDALLEDNADSADI